MGPRVNKQGQSELLLTLDCISSSCTRIEPIACMHTQCLPPRAVRQDWMLQLWKAGVRGAPEPRFSFTGQRDKAPALLEAAKSTWALLFSLLPFSCRRTSAYLVGCYLPYLGNTLPDLSGWAPFQPTTPPFIYSQPSPVHTKIKFLLWPGLCFPGQYIMPPSRSPPCPIWLPSYPHKDY